MKTPRLKSCGVLVFREQPRRSFLLMKHADRWDLPKGHVDPGETEIQCALRELREETGIRESDLELDAEFRFETSYKVWPKRNRGRETDKTLVIFLARLKHDVKIKPTEHLSFQWFDWNPPHKIQTQTVDILLEQVEPFFARGDA